MVMLLFMNMMMMGIVVTRFGMKIMRITIMM